MRLITFFVGTMQVAPYETDFPEEEEDEWDTKNGLRVMAISYTSDLEQASFGCLVNVDGECSDHIRLENILKRKNAWKDIDRAGLKNPKFHIENT